MHPRSARIAALLLPCLGLLAGPAPAAIKVRTPGAEAAPAPAPSPAGAVSLPQPREPERAYFIGSVIFARGSQIVAEVPAGAKERERFVVYDAGMRRRGQAIAVKGLDDGVFLLAPVGSFPIAAGDRLARESEAEAAYRILRDNRPEGYREFLEIFPESSYRPRIGRELFRLAVRSGYPTFPGIVVKGRLRLAEEVGREISLGQAEIVLDRFVIARTDEKGGFLIEGLPKLELPVTLKIRVKDPKFLVAKEVVVDLPAGQFSEVAVDLPVRLTPTVLTGRVLDERGAPLPGAEVWTDPYSMEALTDEDGAYRILRRKEIDAVGAISERDQPLFGGEYAVYAHRKGYSVDRVSLSAESFRENAVPPVRLARQDARGEEVPSLDIDLKAFLERPAGDLGAPSGSGPKLNP
ncbi:MAG: carboxypeptidase regulatory-like domain-containing protein [Deltaproteobacteria bacterium]|nr:carboxypeptidase regulatory-like domain-containing protein [Deltaproteobacteria bacterium]